MFSVSHVLFSHLFSYMEHIKRVCHPNYVPDQQDILNARVQTITVEEEIFTFKGRKGVGNIHTRLIRGVHRHEYILTIHLLQFVMIREYGSND